MAEDKKEDGMGTLKKDRTLLLRDERKMEKLKAKLHTDDDCECRPPVPATVWVIFCQFPASTLRILPLLDALHTSSLINCMDV